MNRLHVLALIIKYNEKIFLLMCGNRFFYYYYFKAQFVTIFTYCFDNLNLHERTGPKQRVQPESFWMNYLCSLFHVIYRAGLCYTKFLSFLKYSFCIYTNTVLWILKCFYKCAKEVDVMWSLDRNNNLKHRVKSQSTFSRLFLDTVH